MPPTIKAEILEMLQELLRDAFQAESEPGDISGLNTTYLVNHERLMANIHAELQKTPKSCPVCAAGGVETFVPRDDRYCATCERCIP